MPQAVQVAVDTANHLITTHEVTNVGTDRSQLSVVAKQEGVQMGATYDGCSPESSLRPGQVGTSDVAHGTKPLAR